jgi:hypothetical protein
MASISTLFPIECVNVTGELVGYQNERKDFSDRKVCAKCFGCVGNWHMGAGLVDVSGGILDGKFCEGKSSPLPTMHINFQECVAPHMFVDGLPKFKDFPSGFGGTDEKMPEPGKPTDERGNWQGKIFTEPAKTGACYCGAVTIAIDHPKPEVTCVCHCESCRRHSGGFASMSTLYPIDKVTFTGEMKGYTHNRKDFSDRRVCAKCFGKVANIHAGAGLVDISGGCLDYSSDKPWDPMFHINFMEARLACKFPDGKPKFLDFPAGFGGTDAKF